MTDEAAAFDALVQEFFSVWFRFHPDVAAEAGVDGFEPLLPAQRDDELSALGSWLETLVVALEELDYSALDPARQIDLRLMFGAARVEHQELLERDWRRRDPLRFLPVGKLRQLTLRSPPNLRDVLVSLLSSVPEYLRLALSQLRPMAELAAPALVHAAVEEAERGLCYLQELIEGPRLRRSCEDFSQIESLADAACGALLGFAAALRAEVADRAAGGLGCGEGHLRFLLRHRHFMDLDPQRARAELGEALACCEDELVQLCAATAVAPDRIFEHLSNQAVDGSRRLDLYRCESVRLATFLARHELVRLPLAELQIRERPNCPRPLGLSGDYLTDRKQGRGTFFLGSVGPDGDGAESLACVRARCIDKTWAGAHLLAFGASDAGWRLPRRLCDGASLTGAWGLYVRERLDKLGYLEPSDRLLALVERREAIQRGLLDLDLHLGNVADTEAGARLSAMRRCGRTELIRLARHPGDALAGVLGWRTLTKTRNLAEARLDGGFSEAVFHDRLLAAGCIPLPLILDAGSSDPVNGTRHQLGG